MDAKLHRRIDYPQEKGTGAWLAATPSHSCGTVLSPVEFQDELRDRYGLMPLDTPSHCDGCNSKFTVSHALSCKVGGLINSRHDESRDTLICLASAGFAPSNVRDEPLINPCRGQEKERTTNMQDAKTGLIAEINSERGDVLIRGFWERSTDCIIDVRICDVHQPSHANRKPASILKSSENDKKKKCLQPCMEQRRHFTPFVVSCEGLMGREADVFLCRMAKKLAQKWDRPYSRTVSFIRTRFAIALLRAKNRCIRGSRISTNSISRRIDWEDGAGLSLYSSLE